MVACGAGKVSQMIDVDCRCHFMLDDAEATAGQYGMQVHVKVSVLAGTDPAQVGKTLQEWYEIESEKVDWFYNLAEAVGLLDSETRTANAKAGVGCNVDETLMKGRTFCGEIKMELKQRKNPATGEWETDPEKPGPYPRLKWRTFAVGSKKAEGIPLDKRFLGGGGQQPPPAGTQATAPQAPPKPASDAMAKW